MKIYTIRDIAKLAGVSVTTVSRVLNHRPDVNAATREKVERALALPTKLHSAMTRSTFSRVAAFTSGRWFNTPILHIECTWKRVYARTVFTIQFRSFRIRILRSP